MAKSQKSTPDIDQVMKRCSKSVNQMCVQNFEKTQVAQPHDKRIHETSLLPGIISEGVVLEG